MCFHSMILLQKLSPEDLLSKKVWKYVSDEKNDDTANVEPTDLDNLSEYMDTVYIALTQFTFADGTTYTGYCSPMDSSGLDYIQPVIIFEERHLPLWKGNSDQISNVFKKKISDIFPIQFECKVPVDGKILKSQVNISEISDA